MPVERIKFERTGGFAGMRIATDLQSVDLTDEQAQTLAGLLDDLDFRELPENIIGKAGMPDQFTYSITVETEEWKHTVVTGDASAERDAGGALDGFALPDAVDHRVGHPADEQQVKASASSGLSASRSLLTP